MNKKTILWLGIFTASTVFGCSAITDFEMDDDTGTGTDTGTETDDTPYSLDGALADPVVVTLEDGGTALVELALDPALPETEGGDAELEAMLGDTIMIAVINDETSTSFNLSEGEMVDGQPTESGQYSVSLSEDRQTINVQFVNDFNGSSLSAGGNYSALIQVQTNSQSIEVGSFTREVEVTE